MIWPESFREAVDRALGEHAEAAEQIECAERRIRELPEFEEWSDSMASEAIKRFVYDMRSELARTIRYGPKEEDGKGDKVPKPRVRPGSTTAVRDAYAAYYLYPFDGRRLGDLRGEELTGLAQNEQNTASGYLKRSKLLRLLADVVPTGKTVKQAVPGPQLQEFFGKAKLTI